MFPMTSRTLRCTWVFTAAFVETWLSLMGFLSTWDLMRILGGNSTHFHSRLSQFWQNDNKHHKAFIQKYLQSKFCWITLFPHSLKCADCTFCQGWLFGLSICTGNLTPPNGLLDSYGDSLYHCLTHQPYYYCPTALKRSHPTQSLWSDSEPLIRDSDQHFPNTTNWHHLASSVCWLGVFSWSIDNQIPLWTLLIYIYLQRIV